jgi:UDP-N-acetylglucosamine 2-epimerase (non-hydrolysing)
LSIRVLVILGTRPEAIKLCPLVASLREEPSLFEVHLCSTGQHREMLDSVWDAFGIQPDTRLDAMVAGQSLTESTARILSFLPAVFERAQPDFAVVQGDTTTTLCGALAAFYHRVPVGHVEAGLRSGDLAAPFPEEMNRTMVARVAAMHFASTPRAAENLLREGIAADRIYLTGNTGIDALKSMSASLDRGTLSPEVVFPASARRRIVVTMHRREALEFGMPAICEALNRLVGELDVEVIFPVHPNPGVRRVVAEFLRPDPRIRTCEPLDYVSFIALLRSAAVVITDSGGIQEEAPYLGVPVVVVREKTERMEGVDAGYARLTGFDAVALGDACRELLNLPHSSGAFDDRHQTYGDGTASRRIRSLIASFFNR